ncbi:MAG: hypothetical protein WD771_08805 [Gemmatimonadaceae bacterium]
MNKDSAKKLNQLLDGLDAKQSAADLATRFREQAEADSVTEFLEKRDSVIRPAMQAFLDRLRERGHDGEIDASPIANHAKSESIVLRYYLHKMRPDHANAHSCPSIRFTVESHSGKVSLAISRMRVRGGGSSGPAGQLALGSITTEKVEELLVSVLEGL